MGAKDGNDDRRSEAATNGPSLRAVMTRWHLKTVPYTPSAQNRQSAAQAETSADAVARYSLGEELGRGGMGAVLLASDNVLDREVAVKQALTEDPAALQRFMREA